MYLKVGLKNIIGEEMSPLRETYLSGILSVILFLTACGQVQSTATPSSTPAPRNISVLGSGKVYLTPDIATISIGVNTDDEIATRAVSDNNIQAQEISEVLIEMGVESDDIQVSNINIFAEQRFDENGNSLGTLYIVENTVFATVRDLEILGEIMGTVVEAGANSIFGIQFDVSDKTQALSEARRAAIKDAQLKAEEIAQAAGVELGDVQTINEIGGVPVPVFEGRGGAGFDPETEEVPESFGQLSLTVDVTVVYNIQ
jgi:uncharacterized protein YggE